MAEVLELTPETYDKTVSQDSIVLVDAWAAWCGACSKFAPVFEKAAAQYPQHVFAKLDTQAHMGLVNELSIVHIPTLLIYREGILLYREAGSPDAAALADLISQVQKLDMDMVRADLAAEQASETAAEDGQDS